MRCFPAARSWIATTTLAAFLSSGLGPATALAQESSTEALAEQRKAEAKAQFEKGAADYRDRRYHEAVIAFLAADRLSPSPALSFNIARAYERLDDTGGALRWYRDYLRRAPDASNAEGVQARVRALAADLVAQGLQQVTVLSTPSGAAVTVDGRDVGVTPYTGEHSIGEHDVALKASDRPERRVTVELTRGAPQDITVDLAEPPAPAREAPVAIPANEDAPARSRENDDTRFGVAPYVVGGAGAALLVSALGFELARRSEESKAEDARSQIEFREHADSMEDHQTTSRVLLGLGSAALVTGGVLFFLNRKSEEPGPVAFGCSPSGCAATARGTF